MKYMKKLSLFILACICTLGSYADDVAVFNALVNRLLPDYSSQITGKKLPEGKNDYFQLSSVGDKIEIAGNNANSMAVGLNYYQILLQYERVLVCGRPSGYAGNTSGGR